MKFSELEIACKIKTVTNLNCFSNWFPNSKEPQRERILGEGTGVFDVRKSRRHSATSDLSVRLD